ncbi:MAG: molybdopterin molybdenumtransferase MoeA, partial [Nitrospirae bacterium]
MKDILGRTGSVSVKEAKEMLLQFSPELHTEEVSIENAYNRVLAEDIYAPEDLPGFDRSTVDGYAVRAEDTYGASETMPALLELIGQVFIGQEPSFVLAQGQAAYVPTGGMLPEGADSVVMIEFTETLEDGTLSVYKQVSVGENVIKSTEDITRGELVFRSGHKLRPQDVAALSALGITRIRVYRKPRVAIIPTGDEVVPPGVKKAKAQVRDVNSYTLTGMVLSEGAEPVRFSIVRDDREELKRTVEKAISETDVVLITGGSSVGVRDFTREIVEGLGSP